MVVKLDKCRASPLEIWLGMSVLTDGVLDCYMDMQHTAGMLLWLCKQADTQQIQH